MKKNLVVGNMELQTDPQGMEATLLFTPNPEGEEWDPDILKAFLDKKRVTHGYTIQSLDQVLLQFGSAAGEPLSAVVAQAIQPEPPQPDRVEWNECPIPENMEEDAHTFYSHPRAPELYVISYESVEVKKTETTKRFLFGAKEREVTVKEKREVREPIGVNPQVLGKGWAKNGMALASVITGMAGNDGVNIFGRPIPGERPQEALHLGAGVEKSGLEIKATTSGFLRRGENWVEVLPFQAHDWEVSLSKDQNTYLLNFQPGGKNAVPPSPELILKEAGEKGAPEGSLLSAYEVGNLLQRAIDQGQPLKHVPISSDADGSFDILVSDDKLKVYLSMKKSRGRGKPLVLKEFGRALKTANFSGPDYAKIQADVLEFYKGPEKELDQYLLSEGTPPEPPGDVTMDITLKYLGPSEVEEIKAQGLENSFDLQWLARMEAEIPSLKEHPLSTVEKMAVVTKGVVIAEVSWEQGKPGKDVFGETLPSGEVEEIGIRLLEGVERRGNQIITTRDGLVDQWDGPDGPMFRVRPHHDCVINVFLAANKMSASLSLRRAVGTGLPLTPGRVEQAYKEKGIIRGLNEEVIARAVEHANEGQEIDGLVFANGQHPAEGASEKLEMLVEMATHKGVTIKADGTADYRNQDQITLVKKGAPLARILRSGQESQEGWDVTGQTITPKESAPLVLTIGENVREETEESGDTVYYAEKGELFYEKNQLAVLASHTVPGNVGKGSGNVKFSGTVKIAGYVQAGYYVLAEEDIFIKDSVEAALVSAGGSVYIEKGIVGGGKGVIRARDTITAGFAEQCTLLSIGDIMLGRGCMKCSVKTNGRLVLKNDKSAILGGKIRVRGGLETFNLGSEKQVTTLVSFGQDYLIQDQIELEEKETQKAKNALVKLDMKLKQAEKQGASAAVSKLRMEKLKMMKIIEKRGMRTLMLREKFEEHYPGEVRIRGAVYPGVILESHGRTLEIDRERKNVTFSFDLETGHIQVKENQ